jgi:hypothetical protein
MGVNSNDGLFPNGVAADMAISAQTASLEPDTDLRVAETDGGPQATAKCTVEAIGTFLLVLTVGAALGGAPLRPVYVIAELLAGAVAVNTLTIAVMATNADPNAVATSNTPSR